MAKAPGNTPQDSKFTIPKDSDDDIMVPLNTSVSKSLLRRIQQFQKASGMSTEQEAIRVGMNLFLTKNGF